LSTSVLTDDDGGLLTFKWTLVQRPQGSHSTWKPGAVVATSATLNVPSSSSEAGTRRFKLTAPDDDNQPNSSVEQVVSVLIDAPPVASINAPDLINEKNFPLVLDGSSSLDPDSPCPDAANQCHLTDGSPVTGVSKGVVSYAWSVV